MSTKDAVLEMVRQMPDDITTEEVVDELFIRMKIEKAIEAADAGDSISHEEFKKRMSEWPS